MNTMTALPTCAREIICPSCKTSYLGTIDIDGSFMRFPPCRACGWQWVGEAVSKRALRQLPNGETIEVKARR